MGPNCGNPFCFSNLPHCRTYTTLVGCWCPWEVRTHELAPAWLTEGGQHWSTCSHSSLQALALYMHTLFRAHITPFSHSAANTGVPNMHLLLMCKVAAAEHLWVRRDKKRVLKLSVVTLNPFCPSADCPNGASLSPGKAFVHVILKNEKQVYSHRTLITTVLSSK